MDVFLQLLASVVLLFNKIEMRKRKSRAWLLGMLGIALISIPFYKKELWISLGYNAGFFILLLYGYILSQVPKKSFPKFWELFFKLLIIVCTLGFCVYLFIATYHYGHFSSWQLLAAIGGLWGTLFLAYNNRKSKMLGWMSYIVSHVFTIIYTGLAELWIVAAFQGVSLLIAYRSIKELQRLPPEDI